MDAHIQSVRPGCGGAQLSLLGVSEAGPQWQPSPVWPWGGAGQLSVCPVRSRLVGNMWEVGVHACCSSS